MRLSFLIDWQAHSKGGLPGAARHRQIPMMRLDNPVGDTQAEAGTRYLALHRRTSIEPFENPALFLDRDPVPIIGDIQSNSTLSVPYLNVHGLTRRRVLQRVVEKLFHGELHQSAI